MPLHSISSHVLHSWISAASGGLWLVSCGYSPGHHHHCSLSLSLFFFNNLHIHRLDDEYWWADCRHSGCPVAAGHCGKFAASLIVIRRPLSVSIKIRKNDTFGGTCSSEYACMRRRPEIEGERREWARVLLKRARAQGHKTTTLPWQPPPSAHTRLMLRVSQRQWERQRNQINSVEC